MDVKLKTPTNLDPFARSRRVHCEEKARRGKTWKSGRRRHVLRVPSVRSLPSDRLNKVHYLEIVGRTKQAVSHVESVRSSPRIFSVRKHVLPYVFTRQSSRRVRENV